MIDQKMMSVGYYTSRSAITPHIQLNHMKHKINYH